MGGFDLYGNYYSSCHDALLNEEMQMLEIDAKNAKKKLDSDNFYLRQKISVLEEKIKKLEKVYNGEEHEDN